MVFEAYIRDIRLQHPRAAKEQNRCHGERRLFWL
jgi:hypothetical protein